MRWGARVPSPAEVASRSDASGSSTPNEAPGRPRQSRPSQAVEHRHSAAEATTKPVNPAAGANVNVPSGLVAAVPGSWTAGTWIARSVAPTDLRESLLAAAGSRVIGVPAHVNQFGLTGYTTLNSTSTLDISRGDQRPAMSRPRYSNCPLLPAESAGAVTASFRSSPTVTFQPAGTWETTSCAAPPTISSATVRASS